MSSRGLKQRISDMTFKEKVDVLIKWKNNMCDDDLECMPGELKRTINELVISKENNVEEMIGMTSDEITEFIVDLIQRRTE